MKKVRESLSRLDLSIAHHIGAAHVDAFANFDVNLRRVNPQGWLARHRPYSITCVTALQTGIEPFARFDATFHTQVDCIVVKVLESRALLHFLQIERTLRFANHSAALVLAHSG